MTRRHHPKLSLTHHAASLTSADPLCTTARRGSAQGLGLTRRIVEPFLKYPFYRQPPDGTLLVAGSSLCLSSPGSASVAVDGSTGHLPSAADRHPWGTILSTMPSKILVGFSRSLELIAARSNQPILCYAFFCRPTRCSRTASRRSSGRPSLPNTLGLPAEPFQVTLTRVEGPMRGLPVKRHASI